MQDLAGNGRHLIEPATMIVLTGGPCSGKSSSLAYLTERLSDHGFMVFTVPETATIVSNSGIDRRNMDKPRQVAMYEEAIFDLQLAFEETYKRAVTRIFPARRKVIIFDRGIMDVKAFISDEDFRTICRGRGLKEVSLRERYHGVIHLVTAADGARDYYTGENNTSRIETPEEAIRIDQRIRKCWLGHPHLKVIDNRTDFEGKIKRAFEAISLVLGMPVSLAGRERFLVSRVDYADMPVHQIIHVEQVFLKSKGKEEEVHVRRRAQDGGSLCVLERRRTHTNGKQAITEEELITEQAYLSLKSLRDPKTVVLLKERACFLWNNQYYELDRYTGEHEGLMILETEPPESGTETVRVPPFVRVEKNIGDDPKYHDRNIAAKRTRPSPKTP